MPFGPQRHVASGSQGAGQLPCHACRSHCVTRRVLQETFKFIGRGSSEANLKPEQLVILHQYKRSEEVGQGMRELGLGV
jgi:hypothetical protein